MLEKCEELAVKYREENLDELYAITLLVGTLKRRRFAREMKKKMYNWKKSRNKKELLGKSFGKYLIQLRDHSKITSSRGFAIKMMIGGNDNTADFSKTECAGSFLP